MNYRHSYHAGNFSDLVKHIVLITVLNHFKQKETPFCYYDTHAGIGLYSLASIEAQKKQEYENGIGKLFLKEKNTMPLEIQEYLSIVEKVNQPNELTLYPGSPLIASTLLREQDRLVLCELHKEDHHTLKDNFKYDINCAVHHTDGYLGMKAFLPPKEKRGLILIDPPFEITNEFECISKALKTALKHFRSGCYMVWYPVKNQPAVTAFLREVSELKTEHIAFHFSIDPASAKTALFSCGILVVNPPWKLQETLTNSILPYLAEQLQATWEYVVE